MRKRIRFISVLTAMTLFLGACGLSGTSKEISKNYSKTEDESLKNLDVPDGFKDAYVDFSFDLLADVFSEDTNYLLSPLSIETALCMTALGSANDTKTEIEKNLMHNISVEDFSKRLAAYTYSLTREKNSGVHSANSIWIKDTDAIQVQEDFLEKNSKYFAADSYLSDFSGKTVNEINKWVSSKTKKRIPKLINELSDAAVMVLLNAVVFDAKWDSPFEKHQIWKESFTDSKGNVTQVEMLHGQGDCYLEDEDSIGFVLKYDNGYSFVAMLPKEAVSMEEFVGKWDGEKWNNLMENRRSDGATDIIFPIFKCDYEITLNNSLQNLGLSLMFDEQAADFSNMTEDENRLFVSEVIHKTMIEVDAEGTKAAAATAVVMDKAGACPDFEESREVRVDRPFVYAIMDNSNQLPIFIGVMESIDECGD